MFLRLIREPKLPPPEHDQLKQLEIVDFREPEVITEEPFIKNHDDPKKRGFYWAINGRSVTELFGEVTVWYEEQMQLKTNASSLRIQFIQDQLKLIEDQISEQKEKLGTIQLIESEFQQEKQLIEEEINRLEVKFQEMLSDLGSAHSKLIQNRLAEVKDELNALVEMYNNIFDNKQKNELDLKSAVNKQREICDEMVERSRKIYSQTSDTLESSFKIGSTRFSARFLLTTGIFSLIAAGWFFSIFAEINNLTNQNSLFFMLSNLFNYLSIYIEQFGQFYAAGSMIISFLILLVGISMVAWFCEKLSEKLNDQASFDFKVDLNRQKKTGFFKLKIRNGSFYSVWLRILPRLFLLGILLIILAVGQSLGSDDEQIDELGKHLSSQVIGSTITLLFTGLFFLFIIKVVEPRRLQAAAATEKTGIEPKNRKSNRELWILLLVANVFLGVIVVGQTNGNFLADKKGLLAIFCFALLVNLTAFTLGYGIRQIGLIKTLNATKQDIFILSDIRKALSGNKPIDVWLREEEQFTKKFISIQHELFEMIRSKNQSLNQLNKLGEQPFFQPNEPLDHWFLKLFRFKKDQYSRSEISKSYRYTFPELSYQLEELRNVLNAKKRELEELKLKIARVREGRSDLHFKVADELRRLGKISDQLLTQQLEIESHKSTQFRLLYEEKLKIEQKLIEGHELGAWMKKTII